MISFALALFAAPAAPFQGAAADAAANEWVAVRAGTIHLVDAGKVVTNGTMLVHDGVIVAIGTDVQVPSTARVVDYGSAATIVPGFIAPDTRLADGAAPERTANPELRASDGYDAYGNYARVLAGGVTSAYVTPARARLIGGQAAIVKLAGDDPLARLVSEPVAIHGSIDADARNVPGYWRVPIPATVDVGIGRPLEQLPRTTGGAILALEELLDGVRAGVELEPYGPTTIGQLTPLVQAKLPWCMSANDTYEIRALLDLAKRRGMKLVLDGAAGAAPLAKELAEAKVGVVWEVPFAPNRAGQDRGKGADAEWPDYTVASTLVEAGVPVAVSCNALTPLSDLRFAAVLARRGGMSAAEALRAITLTPAELFGVADRVGSLKAGKDADFVVMSGEPMEFGSTVVATWVGGELAYDAAAAAAAKPGAKKSRNAAVVVRADEIHVGDGTIVAPGEVLAVDGRIVEVGARVARPAGAVVVDVPALMPGIVDPMGRLGLDGRRGTPDPEFDLTLLLEPGDETDVRVARAGVTTVVLDSPGMSGAGAPMIAYHPSSQDLDEMVVDPMAAIRLSWPDNDRRRSGRMVKALLEKAVEYREKTAEYEQKLAEWTPEPARPEFRLPSTEEDKSSDESSEEGDEKDDDKKDKKKKKDKENDPDPITGIWVGEVVLAEAAEEGGTAVTERLRLQVRLDDGALEGWLRCASVSDRLVEVAGDYTVDSGEFTLTGLGSIGSFTLSGKIGDISKEPEGPVAFEGRLVGGSLDVAAKAERTSREYPVAKRPAHDDEEAAAPEEPKGKPRPPRYDGNLEQYLRAMRGEVAVLCAVDRADEILDCVDAFEQAGIRPVLVGAEEALSVAGRLQGRIAGVLLSHQIVTGGTVDSIANRYAQFQAAGIPVAFYSEAEEGAVDLPFVAAYAVDKGMSPTGALRALTSDAARIMAIDDRVGRIAPGLSADLVALTGSPFEPTSTVVRVWVAGNEVR
ncbi:MAG: amidohydrolase family protein [Planctomycetota bacterium]